ncbi:MAG TPA: cytochrome P450, partial [Acidimicrobiia bacterium]|nr:cytochrome P450 [Acidimicrobiia bacterium]
APVWWHPEHRGTDRLGGSFWVVSKHADVQAVSRDPARFSSLDGPSLPTLPPEQRGAMVVSMDPPDHTRMRRLVSAGFTPRMITKLEDQARAWASAIVDRALEQKQCNFVHEVAYQLPMHMIADIVGIPVSDREWLFDRVNVFLLSTDPRSRLSRDEINAIQAEMFGYAQQLGEEKRRVPADDVWTTLIQAEIEHDDGERTRLSPVELDLFFIVLTIAGSETTRNAISAGLMALLEHPDQLELLRSDPDVMSSAVEEILRWTAPAAYFRRTATVDGEIRGVPIAAGDRVTIWHPSANRDEDAFEDPFRFDITRADNPHVTFGGGGVHYCLGAKLAKREIRVMFEELLARVRDFEVVGEPEYSVQGIGNPITVSLKDLPVRLTAA